MPRDATSRRSSLRVAIIFLIGVLTFAGLALVLPPAEDDRRVWWYQAHIDVVQDHLTDLKIHVVEFKRAHGRYPSNEEGLAVLDNFASRFRAKVAPFPQALASRHGTFYSTEHGKSRREGARDKECIRLFRETRGRVPADAEELDLARVLGLLPGLPAESTDTTGVELAISKGDNVFILSPAGVLSPWGTPYVYENRAGFDPGLFADSPANRDAEGECSVRVDDGLYIYSVGAELWLPKSREAWWARYGPRYWGAGLLTTAGLLALLLLPFSWKAALMGAAVASVTAGAALATRGTTYATCYVMRAFFSYRDPQMVVRQRELLEKYHARGVISEAAYEKGLAALEAASKLDAGR